MRVPEVGNSSSAMKNSILEAFFISLHWCWIIRALKESVNCGDESPPVRTSWELRNDQKPEVSAEKINTLPDRRRRMPKQTSASHILLYSSAFFSSPNLRRSLFCRSDFFSDRDLFDCSWGIRAIICYRGILLSRSKWTEASATYICNIGIANIRHNWFFWSLQSAWFAGIAD